MNFPKPYIPRDPGTLKDAQMALVCACGGSDKAAAAVVMTGRKMSGTQMHRYTAPDRGDDQQPCNMPADVIGILEAACGRPIVTQFLALKTHNVLLSVKGGKSADISEHMAIIGQETSILYQRFSESLKDGSIAADEAGMILAAAHRDLAALAALCGDLGRVQRGEG
jgi:hypothetical protein